MPVNLIIRNALDRDAREYIARAGVTDATARFALNEWVRGIKSLNLWATIVCWPLRSTQNAGTGTTAYSLGGLGTFNGTLVNGPTWGADGLTTDATNEAVTLPSSDSLQNSLSAMIVFKPNDTAYNQRLIEYSNALEKHISLAFDGQNFATISQGNKLNTTRSGFSQNQNGSRLLSLGTWRTSAFSQDDSSDSVYVNGGLDTGGARTGLAARNPTGAATVREIFGGSAAMTGAFAATSTAKWSDAQVAALHTLYKSTLGTGLGLP
jgi:hypothetical protein